MNAITISGLAIYPIKSTRKISLDKVFVELKGMAFDRRLVLIDSNDKAITARTHPALTQVTVTLIEQGLSVNAPEMTELKVKYGEFSQQYLTTKVWASTNQGQHCHSRYDAWFSQYLNTSCRLVYFGERTSRKIKDHHQQVGFADGYPLLLISEASLADLNSRSLHHHHMTQFRPNIVVKNTQPFAEDNWRRIRIGEVEFEVHGPCSRCIFTTVNPLTSQQDKDGEPLSVLRQYRQGNDSKLYFGQNLIPLNEGIINQDDEIEVLETKVPEKYPDNATVFQPLNAPIPSQNSWLAGKSQSLTCIAIKDETPDVKTFIFRPPQGIVTNYLAGQFITLNLTINGQPVNRCYTLSSSPSRTATLAITVKRKVDGLVSNHLHQTLRVGDTLQAQSPQGAFNSRRLTNNKILLLSAGSGITPMLSILRFITDHHLDKDIVFCHSGHSEQDLIARQEIQSLADAQHHTQVIYTLTQQGQPQWQGKQGRLNVETLSGITSLNERTILVCGPGEFMDTAKSLLLSLGVKGQNYHQESFGNTAQSNKTSPKKIKESCTITFKSWAVEHKGDNQTSILEQAEQAGVDIPYSCRSGFCGSCKIKIKSGKVDIKEDTALSEIEKKQGYILACSCYPLTDVELIKGI
ncbi:MAG: hypothetical protein ACI9FJ_001096 [Alteromonadaceae bacterium]|jgi:uncharacterized protein YcbX/ferredoxin-NADP reductase